MQAVQILETIRFILFRDDSFTRGQSNMRRFIYERSATNIRDWSLAYSFKCAKLNNLYFAIHHTYHLAKRTSYNNYDRWLGKCLSVLGEIFLVLLICISTTTSTYCLGILMLLLLYFYYCFCIMFHPSIYNYSCFSSLFMSVHKNAFR